MGGGGASGDGEEGGAEAGEGSEKEEPKSFKSKYPPVWEVASQMLGYD